MLEAKTDIRKRIRTLRDQTPADVRAEWSQRICEKALILSAYHSARTVHVFLSFQSEVNTQPIIEHALANGKRVVVPVFVKDSDETPCSEIKSLDEGEFNFGKWDLRTPKVLRPAPLQEIDLVFAPLVAFAVPAPLALAGHRRRVGESLQSGLSSENRLFATDGFARIGYGAGFYDRFLKRIRPGVAKIGLAFSMQRVKAIPIEPFDVLLDGVITEDSPSNSPAS